MPRTLEIFDYLDVPEVYQTSSDVPVIRSLEPGTTEVKGAFSLFPDMPKTPGIPYNHGRVPGQQTLDRLLRKHLDAYGVQTELGVELRTIEQEENRVRAHVIRRDGDNEVEGVIEAAYLSGVDGAKGAVHKQLGLTFLGETYDNIQLLIADVRLTCSFLSQEYVQLFGNSKAGAAIRPTKEVADDGYQLIVTGDNHDFATLANDRSALEALLKKYVPAEIKLEEVLWISEWRANVRMVDMFSKGRCFVAGDAAHIHTPAGGQDLNSSIQDSFNLAWKLALVYKGLASPLLLESYSAERLLIIADMLNMTTKLMERQRAILGASGKAHAAFRALFRLNRDEACFAELFGPFLENVWALNIISGLRIVTSIMN